MNRLFVVVHTSGGGNIHGTAESAVSETRKFPQARIYVIPAMLMHAPTEDDSERRDQLLIDKISRRPSDTEDSDFDPPPPSRPGMSSSTGASAKPAT